MGIHGLATYLRENRALSTPLILSYDQSKSKPTVPLVVDGWSFIYELHNQSRLPWVYGGELGEFHDLVIRVVRAWISVGFRPHFVFDGPYRLSKFATCTMRTTQSIIQPSLLFFRTSPLSRTNPRFLRENSILPSLCYAATLTALRSLNESVEILIADDEGDPFAVELAGRLKGYVTGRDSDYVVLNAEGYAGYIPMDQMVWSTANSQANGEGGQIQDDAGFVVARKSKARGHANEAQSSFQGIIPPDTASELYLSCVVYTPHGLAAHFQISITLLPLLGALIGNDFTTDRRPINKLFFERDMTTSQRIARAANALKSVTAVATGTSPKKKARHQITSVVDFVDLTIESLLIRSMTTGSGERESIVEKTVEATLQYAIPKHSDRDEEFNLSISPCPLHRADFCPLIESLSSNHPTENETEAQKQVRSLYISAYRRGHFSPGLMDVLTTGTAWPELFLENPDVETVSRSLGRPIREWVYALLDDGIGLTEHETDQEGNELVETDADEESDGDEIVDVVEEDSDEDMGTDNPLAPLQGALDEFSVGARPPPSTFSPVPISRRMRLKHVIEHIRRGTRHVEEPVSVPSLASLLSAHDIDINSENDLDIFPIQLRNEEHRLTVFLRALGSNTRLVKALPSEYLMAAVSLRWVVRRLTIRANEAQPSTEREKEQWTTREAKAFLGSFSWPCSQKGGTSVEPFSPPPENRSVQLTAQILATFEAIEMLSQALLLTNKVPNPASMFSGGAFHHTLVNAPDTQHIPSGLWDACVDGLEGAFAPEKDGKGKKHRKTKGSSAKAGHGPAVHGARGQGMFEVLTGLGEGV
ncbi:hypothetical protein BJV78DRAFT_1229292 [Lactifluus subvellereus]|nr:hypothetical protein BJV78DRAFT_1229292 [Lactifluus subvellereus]